MNFITIILHCRHTSGPDEGIFFCCTSVKLCLKPLSEALIDRNGAISTHCVNVRAEEG